jgi:hypothetical protein
MEDTLDDEISFLEKSCKKLRRDIKTYSIPRDNRAQVQGSEIYTIIGATRIKTFSWCANGLRRAVGLCFPTFYKMDMK